MVVTQEVATPSASFPPAAPDPMQKNSSSAASAKTTAANLEARFDAGRDVLDYFDSARVVLTHGGLRVGAGRKALGKLRKTVKLSPDAIRRFHAYAKRKRLPDFSAAFEAASLKPEKTPSQLSLMADGNFFVDRVHPHSPGTFPFALGLRSSPLCRVNHPGLKSPGFDQ
jgi:hypothetical protein